MRLLWATDGSTSARMAGDLVPHLASPETSDLVVLAVIPQDPLPWLEAPLLGTGHEVDAEYRAELEAAVQGGLEQIRWPPERARTRVETGDPARVIAEVARDEDADLVVIGPRHRPVAEELIGPTASELLIHPPCPVVVAKEAAPWRTVVLATDGSEMARVAEDELAGLRLPGVRIWALAVAEKTPLDLRVPGSGPLDEEMVESQHAAAAAKRLQELGFDAHPLVRTGRPATEIMAAAAEVNADAIALGTHGLSGWRRAVLGSVAGEVARLSTVSVLVAPPAS